MPGTGPGNGMAPPIAGRTRARQALPNVNVVAEMPCDSGNPATMSRVHTGLIWNLVGCLRFRGSRKSGDIETKGYTKCQKVQ